MPSPFPGMDPFLENPKRWGDLHARFISIAGELLGAHLRPKYFVRIEERVYIADEFDPKPTQAQLRVPDLHVTTRLEQGGDAPGRGGLATMEIAEPLVTTTWFEEEIHEGLLTVIDRERRDVVAVIEVLSPSNKAPGSPGRKSFEEKRREVMNSSTHWVEIDLLRGNRVVTARRDPGPHEYLVHVSQFGQRPQGRLWPIRLSQKLPVIPIPLRKEDPEAPLDLQAVLNSAYDRAGYDLDTDYRVEPVPPLGPEWSEWADRLLKEKGLR